MSEGAEFIREGRQFLNTARNGLQRKAVFNNELIFNLIGLSLEKLLVGLCLERGYMPADHTLAGIVNETNRLCPMEARLIEAIRMMDRVQDLCSLDVTRGCVVSDLQIENLLAMNEQVASFVNENAPTSTDNPVTEK